MSMIEEDEFIIIEQNDNGEYVDKVFTLQTCPQLELTTPTPTPREYIFIYNVNELLSGEGLSESAKSQKILQQFNCDFDRQVLKINDRKCRDRCTFFRKVSGIVKKQQMMDLLLLLCQQTIMAHVLLSVQGLLQRNSSHLQRNYDHVLRYMTMEGDETLDDIAQMPYLIRDSGCPTITSLRIFKKDDGIGNRSFFRSYGSRVTKENGIADISITVKKQMYLVDCLDPELIVNVFDIVIDLTSIKSVATKDGSVQVNVRFHSPL